MSKDDYYDLVKTMYQETITESSNVIARAQNPLTVISIVTALLIYLVQSAKEFPLITNNKNLTIIIFYIGIIATFYFVGKCGYFLLLGFKIGGFKGESICAIEEYEELYKIKPPEYDFKDVIIKSYVKATKINQKNNFERMEYIRKSMETILMAAVCCFISSVLYCAITIFYGASSIGR